MLKPEWYHQFRNEGKKKGDKKGGGHIPLPPIINEETDKEDTCRPTFYRPSLSNKRICNFSAVNLDTNFSLL
ncbi:hypothetical protein ES706_06398 [subsurface metagenome]